MNGGQVQLPKVNTRGRDTRVMSSRRLSRLVWNPTTTGFGAGSPKNALLHQASIQNNFIWTIVDFKEKKVHMTSSILTRLFLTPDCLSPISNSCFSNGGQTQRMRQIVFMVTTMISPCRNRKERTTNSMALSTPAGPPLKAENSGGNRQSHYDVKTKVSVNHIGP